MQHRKDNSQAQESRTRKYLNNYVSSWVVIDDIPTCSQTAFGKE